MYKLVNFKREIGCYNKNIRLIPIALIYSDEIVSCCSKNELFQERFSNFGKQWRIISFSGFLYKYYHRGASKGEKYE